MQVTTDNIYELAAELGVKAMVHGDDPDGAFDVEFPTVLDAGYFAKHARTQHGWQMDIRDASYVVSLWSTVTLTIKAKVQS